MAQIYKTTDFKEVCDLLKTTQPSISFECQYFLNERYGTNNYLLDSIIEKRNSKYNFDLKKIFVTKKSDYIVVVSDFETRENYYYFCDATTNKCHEIVKDYYSTHFILCKRGILLKELEECFTIEDYITIIQSKDIRHLKMYTFDENTMIDLFFFHDRYDEKIWQVVISCYLNDHYVQKS